MSYNQVATWMRNNKSDVLFEEISKFGIFSLVADHDPTTGRRSIRIDVDRTKTVRLSEFSCRVLIGVAEKGAKSVAVEMFNWVRVHKYGPKVFKLDQLDCEALENTKLSLTLADYHQPFPAVCIELPPDYMQRKRTSCPQAGQLHQGDVLPAEHEPILVVLFHHEELQVVSVSVYFSSKQVINTLIFCHQPDEELEDIINGIAASDFNWGNVEESREEIEAAMAAVRVGMNTCLLVGGLGLKSCGPANPDHYERLRRRLDSGPAKHRATNARELRMMPLLYRLDRTVNLFDRSTSGGSTGSSSGHQLGPHWRRGHYRRQPHGPGRVDRKVIRIKPVFVNAYLFGGDMGDTNTTYKL